jgi:hypothetical protein
VDNRHRGLGGPNWGMGLVDTDGLPLFKRSPLQVLSLGLTKGISISISPGWTLECLLSRQTIVQLVDILPTSTLIPRMLELSRLGCAGSQGFVIELASPK